MRLYCTLVLNNLESSQDIKNVLHLDDIHFSVLNKDNELISIHLDFDFIDGYFEGNKYIARFKELADTWNDLNLESGIKKEDVTTELLSKGVVENYVMSFTKNDGEVIKDITMTEIGYIDNNNQCVCLKINENAINEF